MDNLPIVVDLRPRRTPREVTTYVNIYADGVAHGYSSGGEARDTMSWWRPRDARAVVIALPITVLVEE